MDGKRIEFKVGLFIFIALACVCIMIIAFGIEGFQFGERTYQITAIFKFTNGVIVGAPVRSAGVKVGRVAEINFEPKKDNYVRIVMDIKNDIIIRKDARAIINSLGIIGEKYVEFIPRSIKAPILKNDDIIIGENPVSMNDILQEGQEVLVDIRNALKSLLDEENLNNVKQTIERIREFTQKDMFDVKEDIADALSRFDDSMDALRKVLNNINDVVNSNRENFSTGITNASEAFKEIGIASKDFKDLLNKLNDFADTVQKGEGTIGQLVSKRELYDQIILLVGKLNSLAEMLNEKGLLYKPYKDKRRQKKSR